MILNRSDLQLITSRARPWGEAVVRLKDQRELSPARLEFCCYQSLDFSDLLLGWHRGHISAFCYRKTGATARTGPKAAFLNLRDRNLSGCRWKWEEINSHELPAVVQAPILFAKNPKGAKGLPIAGKRYGFRVPKPRRLLMPGSTETSVARSTRFRPCGRLRLLHPQPRVTRRSVSAGGAVEVRRDRSFPGPRRTLPLSTLG